MIASKSNNSTSSTIAFGLASAGISAVLWEWWGRTSLTTNLLISTPLGVAQYFLDNIDHISRSFVATAFEASVGLAIALIISVALAFAFYAVPKLEQFFYPWILGSQVIPFIAIAPLVILLFGPSSYWGKVWLVVLVTFFPVLNNLVSGVRAIHSEHFDRMLLLNAHAIHIIQLVIIPNVARNFFAGVKTAVPLSVIGAIVAEFNGAPSGIGKDIFISAKRLEPELMMCGIISSALLASLLFVVIVVAEKNLGPWYSEDNR